VTTQSDNIPADRIDPKSLATLIIELNIARRNSRAYPAGHPLIAASLSKVLRVYEDLLTRHEEIVLGVTSDTLMVDGVALEKTNVVYRDFAHVLFERGIGALQFHRGLTVAELADFASILGLKRELIQQKGGIEQVWEKSTITSITVRPIRYDLFCSSDEDSVSSDEPGEPAEGIWNRFARELTMGLLPEEGSSDEYLDPEILAEVMNEHFSTEGLDEDEVEGVVSGFLASDDSYASSGDSSGESYQKLAAFISQLNPQLRRQFLDSSFGGKHRNRNVAAERILTNLSDSAILETLEDISQSRLNVSSSVFGLLQRLGRNVTSSHSGSNFQEDSELTLKMKTIFREHASEEFVPDNYQKKLNYIMVSEQIPRLEMEEVSDLLKTLDSRCVENSVAEILMNLIREGFETPEERDLLLQNLSDMFGYFLQTGDYGKLHRMIDQLSDDTFPDEIQIRLREEYANREYLEEILDGLTIWGKPRYADISSLINKIGAPFIETLLNRLAEEKTMSVRRFFMDRLVEMGQITKEPIIAHLNDTRWYFLRNLLIILAARNDQSVVSHIRKLLHHNDERVRDEAIKTLVHLRDPHVEIQIMERLGSQNQEQQLAAIQLAERCTSPAITTRLSVMLTQGGYSSAEYETKSAIVHTLSEIGRADVLPKLATVLSDTSFLNSRNLTKLKAEIIRSLPKYPPRVSWPALERIADGSGEMARIATETLIQFSESSQ
jgi:hypothetical protein